MSHLRDAIIVDRSLERIKFQPQWIVSDKDYEGPIVNAIRNWKERTTDRRKT